VKLDPLDFGNLPPIRTHIWRYQSFTKLLSLVLRRKLFLSSIEALRAQDPSEGSSTLKTLRLIEMLRSDETFAAAYVSEQFPHLASTPNVAINLVRNLTLSSRYTDLAATCFVNCWHVGDHESAALWKLYADDNAAIAIKSTVGRLSDSLTAPKGVELIGSEVRYLDYEREDIPFGNILQPAFTKRHSFEHEHEFRVMLWSIGAESSTPPIQLDRIPGGVEIDCDPVQLVEEIVVSPYALGWVAETIKSALEAVGFTRPVRQSTLMRGPPIVGQLLPF
jgi:hypothetical protein